MASVYMLTKLRALRVKMIQVVLVFLLLHAMTSDAQTILNPQCKFSTGTAVEVIKPLLKLPSWLTFSRAEYARVCLAECVLYCW